MLGEPVTDPTTASRSAADKDAQGTWPSRAQRFKLERSTSAARERKAEVEKIVQASTGRAVEALIDEQRPQAQLA